jgi:hypothetical protein
VKGERVWSTFLEDFSQHFLKRVSHTLICLAFWSFRRLYIDIAENFYEKESGDVQEAWQQAVQKEGRTWNSR